MATLQILPGHKPVKCLLVLLPIIFWCNTNDAFWYSEQIDQTKIWPHFPLEFPEEFRNKKYSYVPHTMNVDDDQVFWFFEEPLKTFLNFFFVVVEQPKLLIKENHEGVVTCFPKVT